MRSEAPWHRLEDVVEDILDRRGVTPLKLGGDFTSAGHRVISAKLVKDGRIRLDADEPRYVDEFIYQKWMRTPLRRGDVIMTSEAPLGELAFLGDDVDWVLGQRLFAIRPKNGRLDGRFLYYALQTEEVQADLLGRASGTTVQGIRQAELRLVRVPVPDRQVQVASARLLGALDDRIDLLRQTNATLESIAQALFKSWFIDFDPVRAKAEGREPEGMDAATAALFPAEFEESALGVIPKGWRVAAMRDVVADVYDGPHATPPEASEGPVFLGIKNLTGTSLDLGEVRHISESDWAQWTRRVTPQPDDIVFSYEAALGLFALIPPGLTCCLGRRLALIRPMAEDGTPHFWFQQFIGEPFQRLLDKHTVHGATVNRIPLKEFPSFTVMDPGNRLRIAFESVAQPLWVRIHANRQQALNLAKTRDTLLPRLISGKLSLPEARAQIEDAVTT